MLISAALQIKMDDRDHYTIIPCIRHAFGYSILNDLHPNRNDYSEVTEGFVTEYNVFYDRKEALEYAKKIGQISKTTLWHKTDNDEDELYSEDLY